MGRGSWDPIGRRRDEVARFYRDGNKEYCKHFLEKHKIDYVFVGPQECGRYFVNTDGFAEFGERVFLSPEGYCLYKFE